ncbi:MAG: hypothetical protein NTZ67_02510 [Gammaproteobacteria bacterium]|nr:hypothetical protein [Gammaproteobacteria bacterium]
MLRKKLFGVVSVGLLATALTAASFAGGPTMEAAPAPVDNSGFTLGMDLATFGFDSGHNAYALMFGYVNEDFLVNLGAGYEGVSPNLGASENVFGLRGYLGLRHSLMQTLYFTYGALASYGIISNTSATRTDPYTVGAFVGLDYQPMPHFLLSFKISPYSYARAVTKGTSNNVFTSGAIGASYVFTS